MTITGRRINVSFDVETEVDGHAIIPHSMLEEIADNYKVDYTYETVFCNGTNAAIKCIAICGEFKSEAFGEANSRNLDTDISKKYPVIMAAKRAFDRAIIRLFGFDVYSDSEIAVSSKPKKEKKASKPVEDKTQEEPPMFDTPAPVVEQNTAPTSITATKETKEIDTSVPTEETSVIEESTPLVETNTVAETVPVEESVMIAETTSTEEPIANTKEVNGSIPETKSTVKTAEDFFADVDDDADAFFDSMTEIENEEDESDVATTISEVENASSDVIAAKTESEGENLSNDVVEDEKPEYLKCPVKFGSHKTQNITMEDLYRLNKKDLIWLSTISMAGEFFESQKNAALATITYMERKGL